MEAEAGGGEVSSRRLTSVVEAGTFPVDPDRGFREDGLYWSSPVRIAPS